MAGFLIEVPHGEDKVACFHAIQVFMKSGSHFLANADWGCSDNEHKAWLVVDVETKEEALRIIPSAFREHAKITSLFKVTRENYERFKKELEEQQSPKYHT